MSVKVWHEMAWFSMMGSSWPWKQQFHTRDNASAPPLAVSYQLLYSLSKNIEDWSNKGQTLKPQVPGVSQRYLGLGMMKTLQQWLYALQSTLIGSHCPQFLVSLENLELMTLSNHFPLLMLQISSSFNVQLIIKFPVRLWSAYMLLC